MHTFYPKNVSLIIEGVIFLNVLSRRTLERSKENIMLAKYRYPQYVFTLLLVVVSNSFAGDWEQVKFISSAVSTTMKI